jgi:hypothetical protein
LSTCAQRWASRSTQRQQTIIIVPTTELGIANIPRAWVDRWQPRGRACAFEPSNHPASHGSMMEPLLSISHRLDTNSSSLSKQISRGKESHRKEGIPLVGYEEGARRRPLLSLPPSRQSPKSKSHAQPARGSSFPSSIYRRWSGTKFSFKSENLAPHFRFPQIIVFSPLPRPPRHPALIEPPPPPVRRRPGHPSRPGRLVHLRRRCTPPPPNAKALGRWAARNRPSLSLAVRSKM